MYPKSFLKLLLIGFALAMLPLLFAFGNAALYVDKLAEQSRNTVAQAVQATRSSRVLVEQLNVMERSARQYFVLHDSVFLDSYEIAHNKFSRAIQDLGNLPLSNDQRSSLESINNDEISIYHDIKSLSIESILPDTIINRFIKMSKESQKILSENNLLIDRESASLAQTAERTQHMLFWQTLTLLPVGLLVAGVITYLVAQPIRRMDAAIKHLGEGHYEDPINIDGPSDLRILGERLDWLRSQLQAVEHEKQRFLRHVSHELKTPLTTIREASELLSDEVAGSLSAQQREITLILRESSIRLQKMIENLLHFTAVQFKQPELIYSNVSLTDLLQSVVNSYALSIDNKNIQIQTDFHNIEIECDKDKIYTVLDNLVSNAVKYTSQKGIIRLLIYPMSERAVIEVHDNGPGVMMSDKARLFDPFYKGNGVYESLVSGSGLGLSIAKEYVDAHGGDIVLIPAELGARFRVRLPYVHQNEMINL